MTWASWQFWREIVCGRRFSATILSLAVLTLAGTAGGQTTPPRRLNPPALPPNAPTAHFGPTSTPPGVVPPFTVPNTTSWTALGPGPLNEAQGGEAGGGANASGRIAAVAVDPTNSNNIYIAAAGGGVWQSTNGGATYSPLTDTQATLSMGAL